MMDLRNARFVRMVEQLGMQIMALVGLVFLHFQGDAVRVGPGVLPNAGHLPGDLYVRPVGLDGEPVICP